MLLPVFALCAASCQLRALPLRGKARNWQEAAHKANTSKKTKASAAKLQKQHKSTRFVTLTDYNQYG